MSTSDRELLELAAKAIGYDLYVNKADATQLHKNGEYVCFWKPLDDDGDALRLAASLLLLIDIDHGYTRVSDMQNRVTYERTSGIEATRRAIVRAAAEIGRSMP